MSSFSAALPIPCKYVNDQYLHSQCNYLQTQWGPEKTVANTRFIVHVIITRCSPSHSTSMYAIEILMEHLLIINT